MPDPTDDLIDQEEARRSRVRKAVAPTLSKENLEAPGTKDEGESDDANSDETMFDKVKRTFGFGAKKSAGSQKAISDRLKNQGQ